MLISKASRVECSRGALNSEEGLEVENQVHRNRQSWGKQVPSV